MEALVKWTVYPEPSWEPFEAIQGVSALDEYERTHGPVPVEDLTSQEAVRISFMRLYAPEGGGEGYVTGCCPRVAM